MGTVLELKLVGDISGRFIVPRYQRGYRWGRLEVKQLLDDLWHSDGRPYSLQPVVVKPCGTGEWELIDGQQRLTTLYLIFRFMQEAKLQNAGPPYSLTYATRPGSEAYLQTLAEAESNRNIDYFHLFQAYSCIADWFNAHGVRRQHTANKFYGYLFDSVQVIWYQAPPEPDATTLFIRLNIGRIPLTDAELVKAMLLSLSRGRPGGADRAREMAAEWDGIEHDLRHPDLWSFIRGLGPDDTATHIGLLLDTLAGGPQGRARPPYHTFDVLSEQIKQSAPEAVWNQVVDMHALVRGWFEEPSLYHKIGYLIAVGQPFRELVSLAKDCTKRRFEAALDARIKNTLSLAPSDLTALSYESGAGRAKCANVLLLMNVETIRRRNDPSERYSFRRHREAAWSLEHIHAQQAEGLSTVDQWTTWLTLHREALVDIPSLDQGRRDGLLAEIDGALGQIDRQRFQGLVPRIVELFTANDPDGIYSLHSLTNLALLPDGANSALGNAVFEVKRRAILKRDREGEYIPICTRQVFLKYYTGADAQQIHFWGPQDRDSYLKAMLDLLAPYLKPEEQAA